MAVTFGTITNDANGRKFTFRGADGFNNVKSQPVISIPLVNTTSDNTFLFRFTGQNEVVEFTFALFDDGTDVSEDTSSAVTGSTTTTIADQIEWLRDFVYTEEFDTSWTYGDNKFYSGIRVVITDISFEQPAGRETVLFGRIKMQRGRIGAL